MSQDGFKINPYRFEELIAELLEGLGFEVKLTHGTGIGEAGRLRAGHPGLGEGDDGEYLLIVDTKQYRTSRIVGECGTRHALLDEMIRLPRPSVT